MGRAAEIGSGSKPLVTVGHLHVFWAFNADCKLREVNKGLVSSSFTEYVNSSMPIDLETRTC